MLLVYYVYVQLVCYIILYVPLDVLFVTVSLRQEPIPDEQYNPQEIEDLPDTDLHLDGTYFWIINIAITFMFTSNAVILSSL